MSTIVPLRLCHIFYSIRMTKKDLMEQIIINTDKLTFNFNIFVFVFKIT